MNTAFYSYFVRYIVHSKTRQRLLFLAVVGLFLASFSLLFIQSIMGGLQKNLVKRSKNVYASYVIEVDPQWDNKSLLKLLDDFGLFYVPEVRLELLLSDGKFLSPVIAHGIRVDSVMPDFLQDKDISSLVVGGDLGRHLHRGKWRNVDIISPVHTDSFVGDVPRQLSAPISDYIVTELSEIDRYHLWVRDSFLFNLIKQKGHNTYRIYEPTLSKQFLRKIDELIDHAKGQVTMYSWEQMNAPLMWALNLEKTIMVMLFSAMALLVSISITSGLLLFFSKIRVDLLSFWLLGMAKDNIFRLAMGFSLLMNAMTCLVGILCALFVLGLLDYFSPNVMPAVFVERKLPVEITAIGIVISFFIPFSISALFSYLTFSSFQKENQSFLTMLRSVS